MDRRPRMAPTVTGVAMETVGSFPLGLAHASHYVKPRMALIGYQYTTYISAIF